MGWREERDEALPYAQFTQCFSPLVDHAGVARRATPVGVKERSDAGEIDAIDLVAEKVHDTPRSPVTRPARAVHGSRLSRGPGPPRRHCRELGALYRFTDARALVAYVGFYRFAASGERAATPRLSSVGSRSALALSRNRRTALWYEPRILATLADAKLAPMTARQPARYFLRRPGPRCPAGESVSRVPQVPRSDLLRNRKGSRARRFSVIQHLDGGYLKPCCPRISRHQTRLLRILPAEVESPSATPVSFPSRTSRGGMETSSRRDGTR
jgi:hypothetical protein